MHMATKDDSLSFMVSTDTQSYEESCSISLAWQTQNKNLKPC